MGCQLRWLCKCLRSLFSSHASLDRLFLSLYFYVRSRWLCPSRWEQQLSGLCWKRSWLLLGQLTASEHKAAMMKLHDWSTSVAWPGWPLDAENRRVATLIQEHVELWQ